MSTEIYVCSKCGTRITTEEDISGCVHVNCGGRMGELVPLTTDDSDTTNPKDRLGAKKPQLNLVPPSFIIHVARAMENGAMKYGPYNWRDKKVRLSIYIGAALRHLLTFQDGEQNAQDSEVHHLAHAAACLAILLDAEACDCLIDDRPPKGAAAKLIEQFTKKYYAVHH